MRAIGFGAAIFLVLGALFITLAGLSQGEAPQKPAEDLNLLNNHAFLKANPRFLSAVRQLIVASGYECPRLSFLVNKGESPYGLKLEALCGPAGGNGSYPAMHYAVYPARLKVDLCEKFGAFGGACPGD